MSSDFGHLSDFILDFKKYTLKKIVGEISQNEKESRRYWMFWLFKKEDGIWFWEVGFHPGEVRNKGFFDSMVVEIFMKIERELWNWQCFSGLQILRRRTQSAISVVGHALR